MFYLWKFLAAEMFRAPPYPEGKKAFLSQTCPQINFGQYHGITAILLT